MLLKPPVKCQGIKTKLVPAIQNNLPPFNSDTRWIEPFCGSCVVPLNIAPKRAILADSNEHIITLYRQIQNGTITPKRVHDALTNRGNMLCHEGESFYYFVRERFNTTHDALDFLFLTRACYNGVMRFNARGEFNTPFCRNPQRFTPAYVDRVVRYVTDFARVSQENAWIFVHAGFEETLAQAQSGDFVYADPPYLGRNVQYRADWSGQNERTLIETLTSLPCDFMLSTWISDPKRTNQSFDAVWRPAYFVHEVGHYYHVGPTLANRHTITEALVTNYNASMLLSGRSA